MSSTPAKDVIYIDVDDEITTIIDKVQASKSRIVALVLPKRATTLQSIVNMKLLKKSADSDKKHLVLITAEAGLLPLAAATELYVAKNLQTKPEVPTVKDAIMSSGLNDDEDDVALDESLDKTAAVGDLARSSGAGRVIKPGAESSDDDMIDMGSMGDIAEASAATPGKKSKMLKPKKDKNRRVPDFSKFRILLLLGGAGLVALIVLLVVCIKVLPKANVLVKTNSQALNTNVDLTMDPAAKTVDPSTGVIPALSQKTQKVYSQSAPATGQKNNGQKASGSVTMTAQECGQVTPASDVPAGTGISAGGQTFITQQATTFSSGKVKNGCINFTADSATSVVAQAPGAAANIGPSTFTVAGRSDVSATSGSAMAGGTDVITKIVQQSDIDGAKSKIEGQDASTFKSQLQTQINTAGYYPVVATFASSASAAASSASAGTAADSVTVTETVTYTMTGVHQADLQTIITSSLKGQINTSKQSVLDYGLSDATFTNVVPSAAKVSAVLQTNVIVGSNLNVADIKKQVAGKKTGDATKIIKSNPSVTDVTISYSPFWVTSIPGNSGKITLTIEKPQVKKK